MGVHDARRQGDSEAACTSDDTRVYIGTSLGQCKSESESESERDDADGGGGLRGVPLYTQILADMRFIGMCTFQAQYVPKEKRGAAHISHNTNNASLVEQSGE